MGNCTSTDTSVVTNKEPDNFSPIMGTVDNYADEPKKLSATEKERIANASAKIGQFIRNISFRLQAKKLQTWQV